MRFHSTSTIAAYQYGWESRMPLQGPSSTIVEPDLGRDWLPRQGSADSLGQAKDAPVTPGPRRPRHPCDFVADGR